MSQSKKNSGCGFVWEGVREQEKKAGHCCTSYGYLENERERGNKPGKREICGRSAECAGELFITFQTCCYVALFACLSFFLFVRICLPLFCPHSSFSYPFWAAAPKGSMTYAFTHRGNFSSSSSFIPLPLKSQPRGQNPSLEAHILASRPKSHPRDPNPNLETQILALTSKSQPWCANSGARSNPPPPSFRPKS